MAPLEQFILFGDSVTQGCYEQLRGFGMGAELQNAYVRRLDVINRGYSGYNTKNAVKVLPHVIPTPEQASVKFLAIWFGANDSNKELTHNQHVPLPNFKANLISIITDPLVKAHSPKIILITNPPFEETVIWQTMEDLKWGGESRKQKDAKEYAETVKEVGKELRAPVVDIWASMMAKAGWKEGEALVGTKELGKNEVLAGFLYDGLHLAPEGYRFVFDELLKVIKDNWPDYPPYSMEYTVKLPWELERGDGFWDVSS